MNDEEISNINKQIKALISARESGSGPATMAAALTDVIRERERQDEKWGEKNHAPAYWLVILGEESGEACKATLELDWPKYREEMVHVAAVALAAVEACDRTNGVPPNT